MPGNCQTVLQSPMHQIPCFKLGFLCQATDWQSYSLSCIKDLPLSQVLDVRILTDSLQSPRVLMPGYYPSFVQSAMHHRPIISNFSRGNYRFWEGVPILNNLWKEAAFVNIIRNFSRGNYRFWEGVPILNSLWKGAAFVNIIRNFSRGNYRFWEGVPILNSLWKGAAFVNIIHNFSNGNYRFWEGVPILNSLWKGAAFVNIIHNFSSGNYRFWEGVPILNICGKKLHL